MMMVVEGMMMKVGLFNGFNCFLEKHREHLLFGRRFVLIVLLFRLRVGVRGREVECGERLCYFYPCNYY